MRWFTTCDCCGRPSLYPAFEIAEPVSGRKLTICVSCAAHVNLSSDGTVNVQYPCPHLSENSTVSRPAYSPSS